MREILFAIIISLMLIGVHTVCAEQKTITVDNYTLTEIQSNNPFASHYKVAFTLPQDINVSNIETITLKAKAIGDDMATFYYDFSFSYLSEIGSVSPHFTETDPPQEGSFNLDKNRVEIEGSTLNLYVSVSDYNDPFGEVNPESIDMQLTITYNAPSTSQAFTRAPIPLPAIVSALIMILIASARKMNH